MIGVHVYVTYGVNSVYRYKPGTTSSHSLDVEPFMCLFLKRALRHQSPKVIKGVMASIIAVIGRTVNI